MAWWVAVLSVSARFYSLPRALEIVAGNRNGRRPSPAASRDELARAIDLLLSADVLMFADLLEARRRSSPVSAKEWNQARIIFGVRNDTAGKVDGHAWLEANGKPIANRTASTK